VRESGRSCRKDVKTAPPPRGGKTEAKEVEMSHKQAMAVMLDWFEASGVDSWNFSVLDKGMLGHERSRNRAEVERSLGWGWVKNRSGHDVYTRPARGHDWPVVFLDDLPPRKARGIAKKYGALVVETSSGNCQVWIRVMCPLSEPDRATVQRALASMIGADPMSVSGDHFGRAVGYCNRKKGRDDFVVRVLEASDGAALDPTSHLAEAPALPAPAGRRAVFTGLGSGEAKSESEREYRYCLARLGWAKSKGRDPAGEFAYLVGNIADRAVERGKRKSRGEALIYAEKTVARAMAQMGLSSPL
jgi:hypothetical protein